MKNYILSDYQFLLIFRNSRKQLAHGKICAFCKELVMKTRTVVCTFCKRHQRVILPERVARIE